MVTASSSRALAGKLCHHHRVTSNRHPRFALNELLAHGVRYSVLAALDSVERAEFAAVRDLVQVSDSVLSKHLAALEQAGYLRVEKGRVGRRARTWVLITPDGASAYRAHLRALRDVAAQDVSGLAPSAEPGRSPDAASPQP